MKNKNMEKIVPWQNIFNSYYAYNNEILDLMIVKEWYLFFKEKMTFCALFSSLLVSMISFHFLGKTSFNSPLVITSVILATDVFLLVPRSGYAMEENSQMKQKPFSNLSFSERERITVRRQVEPNEHLMSPPPVGGRAEADAHLMPPPPVGGRAETDAPLLPPPPVGGRAEADAHLMPPPPVGWWAEAEAHLLPPPPVRRQAEAYGHLMPPPPAGWRAEMDAHLMPQPPVGGRAETDAHLLPSPPVGGRAEMDAHLLPPPPPRRRAETDAHLLPPPPVRRRTEAAQHDTPICEFSMLTGKVTGGSSLPDFDILFPPATPSPPAPLEYIKRVLAPLLGPSTSKQSNER